MGFLVTAGSVSCEELGKARGREEQGEAGGGNREGLRVLVPFQKRSSAVCEWTGHREVCR